MIIRKLRVGMVGTNCYLAKNEETNEIIVVDPGDDFNKIKDLLESEGGDLKGILLTHSHFDHIGAADKLRKAYDIKIYVGELERPVMEDPSYNLTTMTGHPYSLEADVYLNDGDIINLAGFDIEVISTPGHTLGGVCYYFKKENILFSGDTLFWESIGRTDFPGGHMGTLLKSIKEKLFVLPDDTIVYPGHEIDTTISHEKNYNMFIR